MLSGTHRVCCPCFPQRQSSPSIANPSRVAEILFALESGVIQISALFWQMKYRKNTTALPICCVGYNHTCREREHTVLPPRVRLLCSGWHDPKWSPSSSSLREVISIVLCFRAFKLWLSCMLTILESIHEFMRLYYDGKGTFCTHV